MLECSGTVVSSDEKGSLIHLEREKCANCTGHCAKFGVDDRIWFDQKLAVGSTVVIATSSIAITIGVAVTLGLPILVAFVLYLVYQNAAIACMGLIFSALCGIWVCRSVEYNRRLQPQISER